MARNSIVHRIARSLSSTRRLFGSVVAGVAFLTLFAPLTLSAKVNQPNDQLIDETYSVADLLVPSPFSPSHHQNAKNNDDKPEFDAQPLIKLIQNTCQSETWRHVGSAGKGTVTFQKSGLSLKVRQSRDVHDQLKDLLSKLRELKDIEIDMRGFLLVLSEDDLKKSIGIDLPTEPSEISQQNAEQLYGLAQVRDSSVCSEFQPIRSWNGQEITLAFTNPNALGRLPCFATRTFVGKLIGNSESTASFTAVT